MSADLLVDVRWSAEQHEVADLERDAAWAAGYRAGQAAERAGLEAAAAEVARSPHPPHLSPSAEEVVAGLVERMLAEGRPSVAPPAGHHPGGPVPPWGATGE